jgi:hypothetical protein
MDRKIRLCYPVNHCLLQLESKWIDHESCTQKNMGLVLF